MTIRKLLLLSFLMLGTTYSCRVQDYKAYFKSAEITPTDIFSEQVLLPGDTVLHNNLQFRVDLEQEQYIVNNVFSWKGNAVYATSLREGESEVIEKIKNIKVVTLFDYNTRFKAGDDIMDSCYVRRVHNNNEKSLMSDLNAGGSLYDYYSDVKQGFDFTILPKPEQTSLQQFAIVFETEAGSAFMDTTISFILKP